MAGMICTIEQHHPLFIVIFAIVLDNRRELQGPIGKDGDTLA